MIHVALEDNMHADPEKSVLAKASIKLAHPETYAGGSDLKEFEVFQARTQIVDLHVCAGQS